MGARAYKTLRMWKAEMREGKIFMCALCGQQIEYKPLNHMEALTVDHIVPRFHGGNGRKSNLQPAHMKCNYAKGNLLEYQIPTKDIISKGEM